MRKRLIGLLAFVFAFQGSLGSVWALKTAEDVFFIEIPTVLSASKTAVKLNKAPGTVWVFKGEELEESGIYTMEDLFRRIPGVQVNPQRQGASVAWFRGVQSRYNSKVLLLKDGVPYRDYWYGNFLLDDMHPVAQIDTIEIIMGPGSVLYGANAFGGVISIKTKKGVNDVQASYGRFKSLRTATNLHLGNWLSVFAQFHNVTDGFMPLRGRDGLLRIYPQDQDRKLTTFSAAVDPLPGLTLRVEKTAYDYPFTYSRNVRSTELTREPLLSSVVFTRGSEESLKLDVQAYHVNYLFKEVEVRSNAAGTALTRRDGEFRDTSYGGGEAYLTKKLSSHTALLGASYTFDKLDDGVHIDRTTLPSGANTRIRIAAFPGETKESNAVYAQDIWSLTPHLDLTAGLRYDAVARFKDQYNYRLGAVYVSDADFSVKTLVGTAFRVPSYREYQLLGNNTAGTSILPAYDPSLQPEHLQTFELSLGKAYAKSNVTANFFYNRYRDYIQDTTVTLGPGVSEEVFFNVGRRTMVGAELSGATVLFNRLKLTPGVAYLKAKDQNAAPLHSMAKVTGSLDADISVVRNLSVGLTGLFNGSRDVDLAYQTGSSYKNPDLRRGYEVLNVRAQYNAGKHVSFQVAGKNVMDRKYYSPHFGPSSDMDMEWPGAEWRVTTKVKW